MKKSIIAGMAALMAVATSCSGAKDNVASDTVFITTEEIGVAVTAEENREYSYTDKQAGYWYGRTHQDSPEWWSGWNMAKKRILADYTLSVDGSILNRKEAEATVYPDRLERIWANAKETFCLVDNRPIIYIGIETEGEAITCTLDMGHIKNVESSEDGIFFIPWEAQDKYIMLTTASTADFEALAEGMTAGADA